MSTVASLGFAVDSSQALKASQNLDRLTASAAKTEAGEKRLSAETKTAEKSVAAFTRETMRSAAALQSATNARARATASTAAHGAAAAASSQAIKLSNAELVNIQYQLNDMATMLASGQAPFTMMMQQGMQLSQIFSARGAGLGAAIRAVGTGIGAFLLNPLNLAVVGTAALAGGLPLIWRAITGPESASAEDTLKRVDDLLGELKASYRGVADEARRMAEAAQSADVLTALFQKTETELRAGLAREIEQLTLKTKVFTDAWGQASIPARWKNDIEELGRQLATGELTAKQFREQVASIRLAENAPASVKAFADKLLDASENARQLENNLRAVAGSAAAMNRSSVGIDPLRMSQTDVMGDLAARLRSQADAMKPKRSGRTQADREADTVAREQQAIADYLDNLRRERDLVGVTTLEREKALAVQRLGLSATNEQIATTERLVTEISRQEQALQAAKQAQAEITNLGQGIGGIMRRLTEHTLSWKDALLQAIPVMLRFFNQTNMAAGGPGLFGGGFTQALIQGFLGFSGGGVVSGPGTATSDSIPARLSNGEFVVRASQVRQPGVLPMLQALNAGVKRFAEGGLVERAPTIAGGNFGGFGEVLQ